MNNKNNQGNGNQVAGTTKGMSIYDMLAGEPAMSAQEREAYEQAEYERRQKYNIPDLDEINDKYFQAENAYVKAIKSGTESIMIGDYKLVINTKEYIKIELIDEESDTVCDVTVPFKGNEAFKLCWYALIGKLYDIDY